MQNDVLYSFLFFIAPACLHVVLQKILLVQTVRKGELMRNGQGN